MTKEIPVSRGPVALVDDEDYERLCQYRWRKVGYDTDLTNYAQGRQRNSKPPYKNVRMHRLLMDPPAGMQVDHINGNGLDNRKANLRVCCQSENRRNISKYRTSSGRAPSSKYKGVSWDKWARKWQAYTTIDGKMMWLGRFATEGEAALAYNEAAAALHGDFARLNEVSP